MEKISVRARLTRKLGRARVAADEGAVGAERLAQRADHHVDLALEPELGDEAAAGGADHPGGVGLVDHDARAVPARELDDAGQRGEVAVHREDGVRDDHGVAAPDRGERVRRARRGRRADRRPSGARASRQPSTIEAWLSASERTTSPGPASAAIDARVGEEAGAEEQARLAALERRELLLEPPVRHHAAAHQPRGARARAPALRVLGGGRPQPRITGEPEVVVRAEQHDLAAVEPHARALRALDLAQLAEQAGGPELLEDGGEIGHVSGPHLTQRAVQPNGSTCTTSLRPHAVHQRGGSVAARRAAQRAWSPSPAGRPQASQ